MVMRTTCRDKIRALFYLCFSSRFEALIIEHKIYIILDRLDMIINSMTSRWSWKKVDKKHSPFTALQGQSPKFFTLPIFKIPRRIRSGIAQFRVIRISVLSEKESLNKDDRSVERLIFINLITMRSNAFQSLFTPSLEFGSAFRILHKGSFHSRIWADETRRAPDIYV